MATLSDYTNNLTFGLFKPKTAIASESAGVPNSIGPVPTPVPPSGKVYTPQYSGGQTFTTNNPTTYTATPAGQKAVTQMQTSTGGGGGTQNGFNNDIFNNYYKGWDWAPAQADWNATGGSKANQGGGSTGGDTSFKTDSSKTSGLLSSITPTSNLGVGSNEPSTDMEGYFGQLKAAAEAGDQAAMDQLNQVYGQQEETLNKQYGQADTDKAQAEKELALQLQNTETDISTQKTKAQESVMTESEKAAEAARSAQRQNRNIMRALGVLGSTYAAEALQNPMNELAKQKATFAKWGMDQVATLDQNLNKFKSEINLQKDKILSQYATIKQKISDDIRYTQQQKATSLQALKAGAQQNLAQIEGQRISYAQQLDQQKLAMTQQIAQILLNKNPNADIGTIMSKAMQTTGQMFPQSQQVATVQATPGRNTLSGFNMQNYVGWNPQAAQEDYKKKQGLA